MVNIVNFIKLEAASEAVIWSRIESLFDNYSFLEGRYLTSDRKTVLYKKKYFSEDAFFDT